MKTKKIIAITLLLVVTISSMCFAYGDNMEKGTVAYYDYPVIVAADKYGLFTIAEIWSGCPSLYEGDRIIGDIDALSSAKWYFPRCDKVCTVYIQQTMCSEDEVIKKSTSF